MVNNLLSEYGKGVSVDEFSGGARGLPQGACGLLAAVGEFKLEPLLKSAMCLQYRGRTGAGVTLKGLYRDSQFYVFHIMFRNQHKVRELEDVISSWGIHIMETEDLVARKYYYEYDLPVIKRYHVTAPSADVMMYTEKLTDESRYIKRQVTRFNKQYKDDARIFSSSKENATFLSAFELADTIKLFDLPQYNDSYYEACLIHLRWPTSQGRGLWWGPQPISLGEIAGIHNGHLSSDRSNAIALEQLNKHLHVGTDSEAIFLETDYLLRQGYTLEEIEWVLCRKFPQELHSMSESDRQRYEKLLSHPILNRMKMSGPATAIVMVGDVLVGFTDRDHLRNFSIGYNDKVAYLGSEQRAIISAAYFQEEELDEMYDPQAGKVVGFHVRDRKITKLQPEWRVGDHD